MYNTRMASVGQNWIPVVVTFLQTVVFHGNLLPVSGSPCLTVPRPPDVDPCGYYPEEFTCINGECKEVETSSEWFPGKIIEPQCVCDDGWFGGSCDVCCDLDCGNNQTCLLDEAGMKICQDPLWPPDSTTDPSQTGPVFNETISNCSRYEQPEISDKCLGVLPCYRGNCSAENVCVCEEGWSGTSCDLCCDLPCVHGECYPPWDSVPMRCGCYSNYTGMYCEDEEPPITAAPPVTIVSETLVTPDSIWYATGVVVGLSCVLGILIIGIPYYMWRQRYTICLRIIYYFKHPEDGDGKQYDVTVSHQRGSDGHGLSEDEQFVMRVLGPKLENEMNFRVCLPLRDFTPGGAIADNIFDAIANSRRTLLVISPDFVQDEWARLSCQLAQHQMLKLESTIVPVLLKDIKKIPNVDRSLLHIMDTITYLEWPSENQSTRESKFWDKLKLCMPKKKEERVLPQNPVGLRNDLELAEVVPPEMAENNNLEVADNVSRSSAYGTEQVENIDETQIVPQIPAR